MDAEAWGELGLCYPEDQLDMLVRAHAQRKADAVAVITPSETLSWKELDKRASRLASALIAKGCTPGDSIGWLGRNGADFPVVLLGVRRAGLTLLGLNWRLSKEELAKIIGHARPRLVIGDANFATLLPGNVDFTACGKTLLDWIATYPQASPRFEDPSEISTIFFTSGTTGKAKALAYTAESVMRVVYAPHTLDFDENSRLLIVAPVFHTAGWVWTIYALAGGMVQVHLPSAAPDTMLAAVEEWKVTHAQWVPAMLRATVDQLDTDKSDISSLKMIAYGTSPIAESLLSECRARFECEFSQVYGLTESVGPITHLPPSAHNQLDSGKSQATGIANPGIELKIVDAEGSVLEPGQTGEILSRLPYPIGRLWLGKGRLEDIVDSEGWLHTGDVGHMDPDGYLTVTDRKKDIIISGGENVYPVEVEKVLSSFPGVAEVAVFGLPDKKWGETVVAAIACKSGVLLDEDRIIAACRDKLAHYKCPTKIYQTACLPRNASGKVLRRELPVMFGS